MDRKNVCCKSLFIVELNSFKLRFRFPTPETFISVHLSSPPDIVQFVLHASTTRSKRWSNLKRVLKVWANERLYTDGNFSTKSRCVLFHFCKTQIELTWNWFNGRSPFHFYWLVPKGTKKHWVRCDQVLSDAKLTKFLSWPSFIRCQVVWMEDDQKWVLAKVVNWSNGIFTFLYFVFSLPQSVLCKLSSAGRLNGGCQHLFVGLNVVECRCRQLLGLDHSCQWFTTRFPVETCKNRIHGQFHKITKPSINLSNLLSFSIWTGTSKSQQRLRLN